MSNRQDCRWCKFSYADIKQGREYLYHDEATCELNWLRNRVDQLEAHIDARAEAQESEPCLHPSCDGKGICNECGEPVPNPGDYSSGGG